MAPHTTATRDEWLTARKALLEEEKELTRRSDELAKRRRDLPWVPVDEEYVFQTNDGPKTLKDLFDGRSQLIVYHFMLGPNTPDGCPGCTFATDGFQGAALHLANHDVTFVMVSRASIDEINDYKRRMGWRIPWVSAEGTDFNLDFSLLEGGYNFGTPGGAHVDVVNDMELMALSVFALGDDGVVYHTYSSFDRGTDVLNPSWQLLDRAPLGRDDANHTGWPRRSDEYDAATAR
jgi:predicted dithiol-disulfide oxidoreductase (DUF899 family)